ncbi:MAG: HAD hydrolase-like protein, partial [Clostridia bacterium]|nr:HAD hydrolase-like protein [Clostridia bacterium]
MKKKAVIFDLDGTLLDTLEDLSRSVNFVLDKYHQPLLSKEKVAGYLGNGYRELIFKSLKDKEYLNE